MELTKNNFPFFQNTLSFNLSIVIFSAFLIFGKSKSLKNSNSFLCENEIPFSEISVINSMSLFHLINVN